MTTSHTRFALAASGALSVEELIDHARSAGLDALDAMWEQLERPGRDALVRARATGIQTTSVDLGACADPRLLSGRLEEIVTFSKSVSNRRLLITGSSPGEAAFDDFVAGLRWLADATEPLGFALVVRTAHRRDGSPGTLRSTGDLRAVLARVDRGNVSAQADLSAMLAAGESPSTSLGDLVGRIGHATFGADADVLQADDRGRAFLSDLNAYGYGDVVAVPADGSATAAFLDAVGGSATSDSERVARIQEFLSAEGLDAVVLNASENIVAATGYWPMNGTLLALIPRTGDPHLFVPAGEESWASRSGWRDVHVYQAGRLADPPLAETVAREFGSLAAGLGLLSGRVAVEGPFRAQVPPHMAHEVSGRHESLRPILADAFRTDLEFLSERWARVRAQKTAPELRRIRRAAAIADVGLRTFRDGIGAGVRDLDLATEVESALERSGVGVGGTSRVRGYAFVMSGAQTSQCHLDYEFSSTRRQRAGDPVLMELAVVADGYWQDLSRVFVVGEPDEEVERIYRAAEAAFDAARRAAVPGALGHDVDLAARTAIDEAGFGEAYPHQTGHGVGVAFHEQYPLLKPGSEHVLEEGNVIAIEPGVYLPGIGGVRNEDNLVVADPAGATTLQGVAHSLRVDGVGEG